MNIKGFVSTKTKIDNLEYSENLKKEIKFSSNKKEEKMTIIEKRKFEFKYGGRFEIVQKY